MAVSHFGPPHQLGSMLKSAVARVAAGWLCIALPTARGDDSTHPDRLPRPDSQAVSTAEGLVAEAYEADFAAVEKDPTRLPALIEKLVEAATKTDQPDRAYALFSMAEKTALTEGSLAGLLRLVDQRADRFRVAREQERLAALRAFQAAHRTDRGKLEEVCRQAMADAQECILNDSPDAATLMLEVAKLANASALAAARKAREKITDLKAFGKEIEAYRSFIEERQALKAAASQARAVLETRPDDPQANATLGRYECLVLGRWFRGLTGLAKGDVPDLADSAKQELELLAATDPSPAAALAVANAWWATSQAEGREPGEVAEIKRHAAGMYRDLDGKLDDPTDNLLANKRATEGGGDRSKNPEPPPAEPEALPTNAFAGRQQAAKLAAAGGGGADTEAAVDLALVWLAAHQLPDGGWSFDLGQAPECRGMCTHSSRGPRKEDRSGATAMALLPFLGRGFTHREGPYKKEVEAGIGFLVSATLQGNGKAYGTGGNLYSQGLAAIALAECYGMTKDKRLSAPTQNALNYIMQAQDPNGGGWRYSPRQPGDTSAFGWQFTALKTGHAAGLQINPLTIKRAVSFLDFVQSDGGAAYGYTDGSSPSLPRTAIGLLCRLQLGWKADHPAIVKGVQSLSQAGPGTDLYFCYYANRVLHGVGGGAWIAWNAAMKTLLLGAQAKAGHSAGSWYERLDGGHGAEAAGRLYCTSLATLILEQYYR